MAIFRDELNRILYEERKFLVRDLLSVSARSCSCPSWWPASRRWQCQTSQQPPQEHEGDFRGSSKSLVCCSHQNRHTALGKVAPEQLKHLPDGRTSASLTHSPTIAYNTSHQSLERHSKVIFLCHSSMAEPMRALVRTGNTINLA